MVRRLQDGEWVRMAGHHVVWLSNEDERVWATIRRILDLLETEPASRVAARLTSEGVPPPDYGWERTDCGVRHTTSGVWHQATVTGIARNKLLRAVVSYVRRSMGDPLRFDRTQPRELTDTDLRADGKPKVTVNDEAARVTAPARFAPPVEAEKLDRVVQTLDRRSGTQRGKRTVRTVSGGVMTFGAAPAPVALYEGPTGRRAFQGQSCPLVVEERGEGNAQKPRGSGREGGSLGNVSRADRI